MAYTNTNISGQMIILVATEDELRLAQKHLSDEEIIHTGVGASNIIKVCSQLLLRKGIENEKIVNVGFCGSNSLPIGSVVKISKTYRLMDNVVEFDDYRNGYELATEGVPCYTSNCFVLHTEITEPCAFDMELNYIAAFPLNLVGAVKIVSDNLCLNKYEESIRNSEDVVWDEVRLLLQQITGATE